MDIAYNTLTSMAGPGIKLRGTPTDPRGMSVENNVFAGSAPLSLVQTETGLHNNGGNVFAATAFKDKSRTCDFDGDGIRDTFVATGQTWWYASSATAGRWIYLNQSTATGGMSLGDRNGDGRCDVQTGGTVFTTPGTFPSEVTYQAASGLQSIFDTYGVQSTSSALAAGTNPAIAQLSTGGFEMAFQATDRSLWVVNADGNGHSTGLRMEAGTSPTIATDDNGGWMVAAQADTSRLWTLDSTGILIQTASAMNTGTSPAIAHLSSGGYKIAFAASNGQLWVEDAGIPGATGRSLGHIPATSPSIAANGVGGWKIAFEDSPTNHLVTVDEVGHVVDTNSVMLSGTCPAIAALSTNGYEVAYGAADGFLWQLSPVGAPSRSGNGLGVAAGANPAIVANQTGGFQIAFHASGDHLWTIDNTGAHSEVDTGQSVALNTSPASSGPHLF
jgi:hypothetical protein